MEQQEWKLAKRNLIEVATIFSRSVQASYAKPSLASAKYFRESFEFDIVFIIRDLMY